MYIVYLRKGSQNEDLWRSYWRAKLSFKGPWAVTENGADSKGLPPGLRCFPPERVRVKGWPGPRGCHGVVHTIPGPGGQMGGIRYRSLQRYHSIKEPNLKAADLSKWDSSHLSWELFSFGPFSDSIQFVQKKYKKFTDRNSRKLFSGLRLSTSLWTWFTQTVEVRPCALT